MTNFEIARGILAGVLVFGFFGGLIYLFLFKAKMFNMPNVARGVGICLLAGAFKVLFIFLADNVSTGFSADWLNYSLGAMAIVGMFVMMAGLASGPE